MRASVLMLFLAGPCAAASILLTNFSSTATVTMPGSGNFAGWDFVERVGGTSPADNLTQTQAYLQIGGWSTLRAGDAAQGIHATASVNYSIPGYFVSAISLYGFAFDGGNVAGENMWIEQPCTAWVSENFVPTAATCSPPANSNQLVASLNMYADVAQYSGSANVGPLMITLQLTPLVHNPEPQLMALVGLILILGSKVIRKPRCPSNFARRNGHLG